MEELDYRINISRLIVRSFSHSLTEKEQQCLNEWLKTSISHQELYERLRSGQGEKEREDFFSKLDKEQAWMQIMRSISCVGNSKIASQTLGATPCNRRSRLLSLFSSIAAVVILLITVFIYSIDKKEEEQANVIINSAEITAGVEKAELIFADGLTIKLDSSSKKSVAVKEGVQMTFENGNLSYRGEDTSLQLEYHILKVPRGGFYSVTLDDGSVVYLNSSSSLRYPLQFGKNERRVFLSGEAFFEVKSDTNRAFYVEVEDLDIRVYGTKFNVNTHKQGTIQTMLLEGKVGLSRKEGQEILLAPSQLAEYNLANNKITLKEVDPLFYTAWKDGWFIFEDTPLDEVFQALEQWYDVDIIYLDKSNKGHRIFARMKRFDSIDIILKALVKNVDIRFKIEGKNILVYK